ncbi:zinc finger protein DPF3-like isoform X8 [Eriocheir sinensis]|uniref:zinc finger protein DPF3-like isoform X8 n=1 Tax=Eriocheir sinensis TaxID=95602 RepID=UPI0021C97C5E|nr:zinc finger protein DPF3-like isoform X8 [Eriocheir sinensis]
MADTLVQSNLEKISSFLQDVQYRSLMINSANYNVRLMRERKTRLPFLDSQTGIAQNPCKLYMSARHRMPGTAEGQLYVYPSQRWCCRKRSYMALAHQHWLLKKAIKEPEGDEHTIVTVENPAAVTTEENNFVYETKHLCLPQEQYYFDESAFLEEEEEEPDDDDDDTYTTRAVPTRKRKKAPKLPKPVKVKTPSGRGRGRKKDTTPKVVVEGEEETPGKPYECQRQGGSGTTSTASSRRSSGGGPGGGGGVPVLGGNGSPVPPRVSKGPTNTVWSNLASVESSPSLVSAAPAPIIPPAPEPQLRESSPASMPLTEPPEQQPPAAPLPPAKVISEVAEKGRAQPSPYCDFCLGDTSLNKKTGESEELVSCSDCGRSGHPTCLQFTAHMMISVRQYRWQCIECKCCTLCGTSENDDQLLFCDDCDRGYHLYCLRPPLQEPPEGEWSCDLCLQQFHTK